VSVTYFISAPIIPPSPTNPVTGTSIRTDFFVNFPGGQFSFASDPGVFFLYDTAGNPTIGGQRTFSFNILAGSEDVRWSSTEICALFCSGAITPQVSFTSSPIATPLPAALPLFATGLGIFGLLGWHRKRKLDAPEHQKDRLGDNIHPNKMHISRVMFLLSVSRTNAVLERTLLKKSGALVTTPSTHLPCAAASRMAAAAQASWPRATS
jgi:hypothetical protein